MKREENPNLTVKAYQDEIADPDNLTSGQKMSEDLNELRGQTAERGASSTVRINILVTHEAWKLDSQKAGSRV